ncbi:MAG: VanZ family protein [Clostridiales bacterium]|nr:VanZ family protein [Clostridiales bacterium]
MKRETEEFLRLWSRFFFALYLLLLIYLMFFAEEWGRSLLEGDYHYNLIPFREIRRYLRYRNQIGLWRVIWNLAGNVVGFMPFGALLPALRRKRMGFWKVVLMSFELTLFIEISQLVLRVGSCDVDDMILNVLGGAAGYGLYRLAVLWKETKVEKEKI